MNLFWQLISMVVFGGGCWAAGDIILKRLLGENVVLPKSARASLAFATGNVALSYLLTGLGFVGGFVSAVLWTVFLGGIGVAIWHIVGEFKRVNQPIQEETENKENSVPYLLIVIIGLFSIPAILQATAPPYVRDSLVYHLLCPKEYLEAGRLVHIEGNIFSAFPKGHEVLMTLLLSISGDRAAQGFSILQQFAAIGELYGLTSLMAGPMAAAICTVAYATVPPVMYFSGCGYVEPALLMTLVGSLFVLFLFSRSGGDPRMNADTGWGRISLLGFLAGWMAALKYTGLIYFGLVGMILLWGERKAPLKKALKVIGVFGISAAPGFCWMVWNWAELGNPVYPMAWDMFGGKDWDEGRALAMSQYFDIYGMGRNLLDYFMLPWRLAFSGRFDTIRFDGAMGPFLIVFLLMAALSAILLIRRRLVNNMMKEFGLMFVMSAAFFVFGTQQVRFWVPSQMLLCTFVAPTGGLLNHSVRGRGILKAALISMVIVALGWNAWFLGEQFLKIGYYKPVFGIEQERSFLVRQVPGYRVLEFMNQNLPERCRILCVWTGAYGYYIDHSYYSDTFIEDFTLKKFIRASMNGKELSQKLTRAGFTHLFLNFSILEKNIRQNEQVIFENFLKNETRELLRYQSFGIFSLSR